MTRCNSKNSRTLSFQTLEDRQLLAGNVSAVLSHGSLTLTGDQAGDAIQISQVANKTNQFTVTGLDGSTVNGQASKTFTITGNISAIFKGGLDGLFVGVPESEGNNFTMLPGSLNVVLGNGNNTFELFNASVGGNLTVTGGSGSDNVQMQTSGIGRSNVNGGNHDCNIDLGGGINTVEMQYTSVERDLLIYNNSSSSTGYVDLISLLGGYVGRNATIQTGNANEYLEINEYYFGGKLSIQTGAGNDEVVLGESLFENGIIPNSQYGIQADSIYADLGAGDDTLHVSNLTGSASFNGNTGTDNLFHDAGSDNGFASGFEYIDGVFQQSHLRNPRVASVTNAIA